MLVIIGILLLRKEGRVYGQEITKTATIGSGTLYPLLRQLKEAGILEQRLEEGSATKLKRRPRIYYSLTDKGERYGKKYHAKALALNPPLVPFGSFD